MGKVSISLDTSGLKEVEEAFKQAASVMRLNSEDYKRIAESFCVPSINWASRSLPSTWQGERTTTSKEWYINHQNNSHRTYSILSNNYEIHIVYNIPTDDLYIRIFRLYSGDTIEYDHITKEYLFRLFDINNLLYQIDNVYKCVHCDNTIIDNDEIKEHKELCIANILEDLEDNWTYIKWMR